jgi:hypothetical protein
VGVTKLSIHVQKVVWSYRDEEKEGGWVMDRERGETG